MAVSRFIGTGLSMGLALSALVHAEPIQLHCEGALTFVEPKVAVAFNFAVDAQQRSVHMSFDQSTLTVDYKNGQSGTEERGPYTDQVTVDANSVRVVRTFAKTEQTITISRSGSADYDGLAKLKCSGIEKLF